MIYQRIQSNFKPTYSKELAKRLYDEQFIKANEHFIKEIIDSNEFWNRLRERVDFLAYAVILKIDSFKRINPYEMDPLNADFLFSLVEDEVKKLMPNLEEILIDVLFRQYVRCLNGHFKMTDNYVYFTAPFFSSEYEKFPDQGTIWLDQLTTDLFDNALDTFVEDIIKRLNR